MVIVLVQRRNNIMNQISLDEEHPPSKLKLFHMLISSSKSEQFSFITWKMLLEVLFIKTRSNYEFNEVEDLNLEKYRKYIYFE
jgi:hypothetical protein